MELLSTKELASIWKISQNRITILAGSGRIPGARLIGNRWMFPRDVKKPDDARFKEYNDLCTIFPRFFCLHDKEEENFFPPLSSEEKSLRDVMMAFHHCEFEKGYELAVALRSTQLPIQLEITNLFFLCILCMLSGNFKNFNTYYKDIYLLFDKEFAFKEEMKYLLIELDSDTGINRSPLKDFSVPPNPDFCEEAIPFLQTISAFCFAFSTQCENASQVVQHELSCKMAGKSGFYAEEQLMHAYLSIAYHRIGETKKATVHIRRVIELAYQYDFLANCCVYFYYFNDIYSEILKDYPREFAEKIEKNSYQMHEQIVAFSQKFSLRNFFVPITHEDLKLVLYSLQNYTNTQISELLGLSTVTISTRYNNLYKRLGVENKKGLVELIRTYFDASGNEFPPKTANIVADTDDNPKP